MKNLRRLISMVLVLCTLLSFMTPAVQAVNSTDNVSHPFTDVKKRDWYNEYVTYVWENGLFNGVTETTFAPEEKLTRGMFVTVLARMANVDTANYSAAVFRDVDPASWYGPYVAWAAENGITTGTGDGSFSPNAYVSRDQIATFILRYLVLIGFDTGKDKELSYADSDQISDYAQEAVAVCSALGLFEGDTNNCFRPKDNANRAEAATICARLHQMLTGAEMPDDDDKGTDDSEVPGVVWPPIVPDDDDDDTSGSVKDYYKITFANPGDKEFAASSLPDSTTVEAGSLIYNLPLPEKSNYVFCGWFYDENLTQLAATTDTVNSNMTLYPKMVQRTAVEEEAWPVYALNYVLSRDVGSNFTIQVQASSAQQIRDSLKFAAFSEQDGEIEYDIINEGGGIYTLKPVGGLVAGDTYQVVANDRDRDPEFNEDGSFAEMDYVLFIYQGEVMPSNVQYYNIIVAVEEHSTMRIDDDVIFLPYNQVYGMDLENAMLYTMTEDGFEMNDTTDTFVYRGDALEVGDVVAIYDGVLDEDTREVEGELAYVKITQINGNTYSYGIPALNEVLFDALTLPVPLDDADTEEVDGAFFNKDGTITVYNEYLDFSGFADYEELPLDGETTARVGDYLALYTGELGDSYDYAFYEIIDIQDGGSSAVTTFTVIARDEVLADSVYEVYTGDLGITEAALAEIEAEAEKQAIESGFAEEAANYLTEVLLAGEEMQEVFGGYTLQNVTLLSSATEGREWYEGGEWNPNVGEDQSLSIEAGAIEAGVGTLMVEVGRVDVHVDSSRTLEEITAMSEGLRLELGLTFTVQIGNYMVGTGWSDCISLQVSASFVQEVGLSPYASIDKIKGKTKLLRIPYTKEYRVKAGVDVGTYVGVGGTFTVITADDFDSSFPWEQAIRELDPKYDPKFPNVDSIAKKIREMMGDETTFALGNGEESLVSIYRDLLEKEIDYVEILAIRCPGCPIKIPLPYKIGKVVINLELVISAKMSVTIGMAIENLSVRRYEFTAWINVVKFKAGYSTNSMDLQTPYSEMNLYLMGNIGLRVGPRISLSIHLLSIGGKKLDLANAGFSVYFGYSMDMYGIYFAHLRVEDGRVTDGSRDVGALESAHGIFLDLDFHLGVLLDLISVDIHALDLDYKILDRKGTPKIFEATKRSHNVSMWNNEPYTISNDLLKMNTLVVKTGQTGWKNASYRDFNVELSNPYFSYNPNNGQITVTDPGDSVEEVCEIRLTYLGSDTLFSITPLTVTINLTWKKTWPTYSVRFCDTLWQSDDGDWVALSMHGNPVREYRFVEGETITGIEVPSREVPGYDFLGWYYADDTLEGVENNTLLSELNNLEGYIMPSANVTIGPLYKVRTDIPYVLNYYIETTDGTGAYELYKSVRGEGTTDSYFPEYGLVKTTEKDLSEEEREGLEIRYDLLSTAATNGDRYVRLYADGSGSGNIYLDRNTYSVFYHINNSDYPGASVVQVSGVYGAELTPPPVLENATVPGWTFMGWLDMDDNPVEIPTTVPSDGNAGTIVIDGSYYSGGTHYFAHWAPNYNYYTVNHYVMTPDGEYELVESQVGSDDTPQYGGNTGDFIEASEYVMEFEGAELSHYTCTTADGVETFRVVGVPGTGLEDSQHNGQVLNLYYDRDYSRVYWVTDDAEIMEYYYIGQPIVAPEGLTAEEKTGYVLDGWKNTVSGSEIDGQPEIYREGSELVMGSRYKRFEPNYVPADTKYTVIHKRPADWTHTDYSDEDMWETVVGSAVTDSVITAEVKQYDGFVSPEAKELYIKADGSSIIVYEYERQSYGKTLDFNGGEEKNYARNYFYDLSFNLPMNVTRAGHEFKGWKLTTEGFSATIDEDDGAVYGDCLTSMQALTFVAQWEEQPIEYKVEHYLEQLDGTYQLQQTDKPSAAYNAQVSAVPVDFTGFTADTSIEGTVADGVLSSTSETLVLKLYYTRNQYEAKWYAYDGTTLLATTKVKYQDTITVPDTFDPDASYTGYTLTGWKDSDYGSITTKGASFGAKEYGIWTANTYTVVFDANGGSGTMADQSFTYDVTQSLTANDFTRTGYTFAGWSTQAEGDVAYTDQAQVKNLAASGTVTLYAVWAAATGTAYTVEYYGESLTGGYEIMQSDSFTGTTGAMVTASAAAFEGFNYDSANASNAVSGMIAGDGTLTLKLYYSRNSYIATWLDYDGDELDTTTVKYGAAISEPEVAVTREGYTFGGWNITGTMPAANTSFSAQDGIWTANTYTVVFDANGGSGSMADQSFTYDVTQSLTANDFTRTGYTFAGWSTQAEGDVAYTDQTQVKNLATTGTVTLYAIWIAGDGYAYTVEHYIESLEGQYTVYSINNFTGVVDSTVSASAVDIEGFTYDADNANNVASGAVNVNGTLVLKLYYSRNSYTVTWLDYDGTGLGTTSVKYGAAISEPALTATREGYTFGGWNVSGTMAAADTSFSAQDCGIWTANTYTVRFDANGGEGTMADQSFTYDAAQKLTASTVSLTGYVFAGWSTQTNGTVVYADKAEVENLSAEQGDVIILYAVWMADTDTAYSVEYYGENLDGTGYVLLNIQNLSGTTGATATADPVAIDGFAYDSANADNVVSDTITADGTLVLKLYYNRNSYTVTWLDYDGDALGTTTEKYGATITEPALIAVREGYAFDGWNVNGTMAAANTSFSAQDCGIWTANTYTVRFDANGGEGTMADQNFTYDVAQNLTANTFSLTGYVFAGWSTQTSGTVVYTDEAKVENLSAEQDDTIILYAVWTADVNTAYAVEYYGENLDGTDYVLLDTKNLSGTTGATVTAELVDIEGFTYDSANAGNVVSATITADGTLVLKLYYTRNSYTLTLDFNGESMKQAVLNESTQRMEITCFDIEDQTISVKYGQPLADVLDAIDEGAYSGYTFGGWGVDSDAMPAVGVTLTAQWDPIKFTVIYSPGVDWFGTVTADTDTLSYTYYYGDIINAPDVNFTNSNANAAICGWLITSSETTQSSAVAFNSWPIELVYDNYLDWFTASMFEDESAEYTIYLTPFWGTSYTVVSFYGNGGLGDMDDQVFERYAGGGYLSFNGFTREGYAFTGWNTSADGSGTAYGVGTYFDPVEDSGIHEVSLYAQWKQISE